MKRELSARKCEKERRGVANDPNGVERRLGKESAHEEI
jgi:hypothetical protein